MRLNRLLCKGGAAIVSIALSIYLWIYPLPDHQFWRWNIIDLVFVVTALAIPVQPTQVWHTVRNRVERLVHNAGKRGLGSYQSRA